jgi:DNA repair protein RadC
MESENVESLVGEIDITYKARTKLSTRPVIKTPEHIYKIFLQTWDMSKIELVEQFKVMLLNRCNKVLGICTLTTGSVTNTIADPKQVFAVALIANAVTVVIAHNHPSGCLRPSRADENLTERMRMAGQYLEIKVMDHLIVTKEGFYSFAEMGVI